MEQKRNAPQVCRPERAEEKIFKTILTTKRHIVKVTPRTEFVMDVVGAVLVTTAFVISTILYFVIFGG